MSGKSALSGIGRWVRVDDTLESNPKLLHLADVLDGSLADAGWLLLRLWWWTARTEPSGEFRGVKHTYFSRSCELSERDIEALLESGWITRSPNVTRVHDWLDYQSHLLENAEARLQQIRDGASKRQREKRERDKDAASQDDVTPRSRVTSRDSHAPTDKQDSRNVTNKKIERAPAPALAREEPDPDSRVVTQPIDSEPTLAAALAEVNGATPAGAEVITAERVEGLRTSLAAQIERTTDPEIRTALGAQLAKLQEVEVETRAS